MSWLVLHVSFIILDRAVIIWNENIRILAYVEHVLQINNIHMNPLKHYTPTPASEQEPIYEFSWTVLHSFIFLE